MYQNLGYQLWKQKQTLHEKESDLSNERISLFSGVPLKIPFGLNEEPGSKGKDSPTSPRKKASDSTIGSTMLRRQIKSYMSSTSVPGLQSKLVEQGPQPPKYSSFVSNSTNSISRRGSQIPEGFDSYMEAHKVPRMCPKPNTDTYSGPYYRPPAADQSNLMTTYVYPQTYTPIYIPIIVQPSTPSNTYGYMPTSSSELLTGKIKFFDETQNYGFFTLDCNGSDLFVHYDDLLKSGITKEFIQIAKVNGTRFAFRCVSYYGKYNLSYKAIDVQILQDAPNYNVAK